jgi:hypothetical protein
MSGRDDDGFDDVSAADGSIERRTLDSLFSAAYEELRRLASSVKRGDGGATLSPTALVNEAWVKLAKSPRFASTSPLHFKRIAAPLPPAPAASGEELLALDGALHDLARLQPRQALMIESRFFGGLETGEIASLLQVSEATILRDWRAARAWLAQELRRR